MLNPASWLLRKTRACCATAHWHRADTRRGKTVRGPAFGVERWLSVQPVARLVQLKRVVLGMRGHRNRNERELRFSNHLILGRDEVVPA